MPTYQYRCTECGRDLEVVQKFSDASLTECPTCAGQLRKVFNAVGVVFKGSGFYRNDSRAAAGVGDSNGGKQSEKSAEKSNDTADSKPAKVDAAKSDSGRSDSGRSDSGRSDSGRSDSGRSGSGKSDSSTSDSGKSTVAAGSSGSSSTGSKAATS